ncbi:MAG TPA: bifunctional diaminohydroxyphosphoribosylaminopyrimidine deaminase/5-amino-6-(5-phosphoribosylamino)uracil reductase RibD, partial [Ilumatobacteraceae bacterium]|nr:bifunctional diaminohydroxyphosphoribosylaminopyrimidine deaminase/5-amino-6-(5-phosphoribosylamino)uracil reductase RibD [Ilumatobacteraceae bacterium]
PGGRHAEVVALDAAGDAARGATLVCTLEPCSHHGRTPPCTDAIIAAGVARVVVAITDPDKRVAGTGLDALRRAGIIVESGVMSRDVEAQLAPYLLHRRTGRPYVVCKLATTADGGTAAPDGTSQWITGEAARRDAHRLRAESDAILVGAGTVRADDPALTVRHVEGDDPLRVVLGSAPADARVRPCIEWRGGIDELLDDLGRRGIVQLMVEGGSRVIGSFHAAGLVDRYVLYVAPALFAGADATPAIAGATAATIDDLWRGRFDVVERVGDDLRLEIVPALTANRHETRQEGT